MASSIMSAGAVIGHYRVLEPLGQGGMGVVYRAHDERLGRDVALKFLPSTALDDENARKRFRKEARALAKLSHPNIAIVYDFDSQDGVDFLVTEFIPGETLGARLSSGALPQKEVLRLGVQLADGLVAAHEAGVLHRDLKPGNLQLTPDGKLKILDFGLAQFCHLSSGATTESVSDLQCAGTLSYAAPEQLRGEPATRQTDIYSAGTVLYEMCTGRKAFGDAAAFRVMHGILHEMPKLPREHKPEISAHLEQIILKCLDKEACNRYQSATELAVDLRRLSLPSSATYAAPELSPKRPWGRIAAAVIACVLIAMAAFFARSFMKHAPAIADHPAIHSLAVLPLQNLSGSPAQDYFADGMTEELITDLAQISALRVISRTSVMSYKGSNKSLPQIARELNVDAILEGSVERVQNRVRITAQLIEAPNDQHLWAKSYEGSAADVLTLQDDVARSIANEIQIKLTAEELRRLNLPRPVNPEAHEDYLLGRYYWNKSTADSLKKSIEYLQQAVAKDPHYALAYAALSDCYYLLPDVAGAQVAKNFQQARAAALKALQLDPSLAEGHAAMASVREDYDWDWAGAEREYKEAIELNPGLGIVHEQYSNLLAETGRIPEALPEARKALELDPLSSIVNSNLASMLYFAGDYDEAIAQTRKTLALDPGSARAHRNLGRIYTALKLYPEATAEFRKAIDLSPGTPEYLAELGYAYGTWGHTKEAAEILKQLKRERARGDASDYQLAVLYIGLGDLRRAMAFLAKAVDERAAGIDQLKSSHLFDPVRAQPSFRQLVSRVGL
ncbi:MAG TPA: protein kinase [Terriglobales bacterium]|nr:protein kinase [Terriglobales bacterium]